MSKHDDLWNTVANDLTPLIMALEEIIEESG